MREREWLLAGGQLLIPSCEEAGEFLPSVQKGRGWGPEKVVIRPGPGTEERWTRSRRRPAVCGPGGRTGCRGALAPFCSLSPWTAGDPSASFWHSPLLTPCAPQASRGAAMAVLYPSLEDLKVDQAIQAQARATPSIPAPLVQGAAASQPPVLYPNLAELESYMGLSLSSQEVQQNLPPMPDDASTATARGLMVAPVSGNNLGVRRAEIKPGVREIHLCKDERGKTGLRLQPIDQGLFVQLVQANSPAALVGLRFGDQILQIDGHDCAGWSKDKAHRAVKKASAEKIVMVVRDRPFQRTVTTHRDSTGHLGFVIKKGKVCSVVKGSSAARNGLLTNHYLCEVNGQNVIGMKDKEITEVLAATGQVVTLTIIPTVIYEHMVRRLSPTLLQHTMDRSIPDV
ncbi:syntenin-2 isoform X1 [Sorex araneus]|uniref:syntenin-2 isoform X1 n=4 Tax=Sorex araneus TaxID=42254 RepID=UPI0024340013|nr:syntenin-2 isoform X1 [Sorex araneus]